MTTAIGKIVTAEPQSGYRVRVVWDDGKVATINLSDRIQTRPKLAPLADEKEFFALRVSEDGWSLEWPSGIDFGATQLGHWASLTIGEGVDA